MDKRVPAGVALGLLLALGLWWLLAPERGGEVVERELARPEPVVVAPVQSDEIVRGRRRPPREERPLLEPVKPEIEPAEPGWVNCLVAGVPPGTSGAVMFPGRMGAKLRIDEDAVRFRIPDGVTSGRLVFDGYGAAQITFSNGACDEVVSFEGGPAVVTGMVTHADGRPAGKVWVQGCWNRVATDVDGSYYLESRAPADCQVRAFRKDGVFTIWSEPVEVSPKRGQDVVADLALPPYQTAGLGAEVREHPDGIEVTRVLDGGAAAEAGLGPGDVVVEIDGEPTAGLALREFVERALGPEGTEVELVVAGEPERVVEIRRRTMPEEEG